MALTQSDVDAIKAAIASGVSRVKFADGREVEYRSTSDMMTALALAQNEVAGSSGGNRVTLASFCRD